MVFAIILSQKHTEGKQLKLQINYASLKKKRKKVVIKNKDAA